MKKIFLLFILSLVLVSCSQEFDINQFKTDEDITNVGGDTVYIPLAPEWTGFNKPKDILIGKEPFIYVADTDNDRVVMLNLDGQVLSTVSIKKPVALAQDYKLNLYVIASFDTTLNGTNYSYSALYKLNLVESQHKLDIAPIKRILPQVSDLGRPQREYTGITVFYDNSYFVSRRGPSNTSFIDPDNSILIFNQLAHKDTLIGRVPNLTALGTGLNSANNITSLISFGKRNTDFIATYQGDNSFKVQWMTYVSNMEKSGYESKLEAGESALMKQLKFGKPEGAAIDNSGNIYIADAEKDSIYKFNPQGEELQSFGGPSVFNHPHAVAHFNRTLYVADTDNNRILRFVLSTEVR